MIAKFSDFRLDGYRSQSGSFNRKEFLMAFSDFRWWGIPYKGFFHLNERMFVFLLKSVFFYNNARRIGEFEIDRKEFIKKCSDHAIAIGRIASEVCK